jgi:hypothetical protein
MKRIEKEEISIEKGMFINIEREKDLTIDIIKTIDMMIDI